MKNSDFFFKIHSSYYLIHTCIFHLAIKGPERHFDLQEYILNISSEQDDMIYM